MTDRRNILFIIIDQLRADCVAGALAGHVDLPNIRAFGAGAVDFRNHYSVVNPCGPSRASILTGQYAMNHRSVRNGTPLRHDTPTLASEMRKAGYLPMLFGYTDTSGDPRVHDAADPAVQTYEYPMAGFHEIVEMRAEMSFPWRSHLLNKGYRFDRYEDVYKPVAPDGGAPRVDDPAFYTAEDSDTAFLTDRFLDHMPGYAGEGWFAHLTYIRPHPPLVAPAPYNRMYDPAALPKPVDVAHGDHPFLKAARRNLRPAGMVEGFDALGDDPETVQTLRAVYLGLATEVDAHVGRVLAFLDESGQADDTLVVLTADHGEMLGDQDSWGKSTIFEAAFKVPLMIRAPGGPPRVVTAFTESVDLTPTILDWLGRDLPNAMDGRSLLPLAQGQAPDDWRNYVYAELDFGHPGTPNAYMRALGTTASTSNLAILRDGRFTLVEFAADLDPILFDGDGEGEARDVASDPAYGADLARLSRKMLRHRMRNADHTLSMSEITNEGPKTYARRG